MKTETKFQTIWELTKNKFQGDITLTVEWLFKDYYSKFTEAEQQATALIFIQNFIYKYLNMEMCHPNENVFKMKLYYGLNKYYDFLIKASAEYEKLFNADTTINENYENSKSYESTENGSEHGNRTTVGKSEGTTNTTTNSTTKNTNSGNNKQSNIGRASVTDIGNLSETTNNKTNATNRDIRSDYPQSTVNANTIGNPAMQSWKYASMANDNNSNSESNIVHTNDTSNTSTSQDSTTITNENSNKSDGTFSSEQNSGTGYNVNNTDVSDKTNDVSKNGSEKGGYSKTVSNISDFEKVMAILEYVNKNTSTAIYNIIEKLAIYFISNFVDEERDWYIDTNIEVWSRLTKLPENGAPLIDKKVGFSPIVVSNAMQVPDIDKKVGFSPIVVSNAMQVPDIAINYNFEGS